MGGRVFSRRVIAALGVGGAASAAASGEGQAPVDRRALVRRHSPVVRSIDPRAPLSVGNGELAMTVDVTGLQSIPDAYQVPLNVLAQWAWHSNRPHPDHPQELRLTPVETHGRTVHYPLDPDGQQVTYAFHRANPHRLHLARIALQRVDGSGALQPLDAGEIREVEQRLDLWTGVVTSRFTLLGDDVWVETCCHPELDILAVAVASPLVESGRLAVSLELPAPDARPADKRPAPTVREDLAEFRSELVEQAASRAYLRRRVDEDGYDVLVGWTPGGSMDRARRHVFAFRPARHEQRQEVVLHFLPDASGQKDALHALPGVREVQAASQAHWETFWSRGGALEVAGSDDPRAMELERRVVLSQYQTAINCAGSLPPAESGLYSVSWHGKFHLEMHWWHAAHFSLWGRGHLMERSLEWYRRTLPEAQALAQRQGYAGARWPKMVGPHGRQSPSPVAPLLIWQQPHPISFAELCYAAHPTRETLERFQDVVFQTATFMASFASPDGERYVLGPPVVPAQEVFDAYQVRNPTFELEYWRHGLGLAQAWRRRLGLSPDPEWERVRRQLAPLPVRDGVYLAHENAPETFSRSNRDHPSMLAALGMLPGEGVDRETMRRTLRRVLMEWRWQDRTWGWDYPMTAMTAARLEEPRMALHALLMESPKNRYLPNGHIWQEDGLPAYLPANGGLLAAVALMAAGWRGRAAPGNAPPGFPADGSWRVRWEGLNAWL